MTKTIAPPRNMPAAYTAIDCGACDQSLDCEDGDFYCSDCGLDYGNPWDGAAATRTDDGEPDCNEPYPADRSQPRNPPEGRLVGDRRMIYVYPPCPLVKGHPEGNHTGGHHWEADYYPVGTSWDEVPRG
jgi:hypothetical protein